MSLSLAFLRHLNQLAVIYKLTLEHLNHSYQNGFVAIQAMPLP
jgi:hypothetical protein